MIKIREENIVYPHNGLYKGVLRLKKRFDGRFVVEYKELTSPLFNNSFTERFNNLDQAEKVFNEKLAELSA